MPVARLSAGPVGAWRILLPVVALIALLGGCTGSASPAAPEAFGFTVFAPEDRKPGPNITAKLLDGSGDYSVSDYAGDVVVVNFWASWCGPCVAEAVDLEQTYQATKGQRVTFLGVNTRGDDLDAAKQFVLNHKPTYPNVFDPTGKVALSFTDVPPTNVPATIVLDRQGRVAAIAFGAVVRHTLEPVVTALAAEAG